uniref:Nucleoside diphosphate kinase n=1 Tax=Canis lupus familiaris TaxID=9615 RepID=A0A8I3PDF4_CANLF
MTKSCPGCAQPGSDPSPAERRLAGAAGRDSRVRAGSEASIGTFTAASSLRLDCFPHHISCWKVNLGLNLLETGSSGPWAGVMGGVLGRASLPGLLSGPWAPGPSLLAHPNSGGSSWTRERTLVAVKPDGVQRRLVGDVIQRFERRGFKLVGMKMLQAPERVLAEHHHDLQRKPFYPPLISYMTSGPVVAMVWEGPSVVCSSRTMIGHTDSAEATPGTIRGDFSIHISRNIIHASDSVEGARREIQLWFQSSELVDWADKNHESSIYAA